LDRRKEMNVKELIEEVENDAEFFSYLNQVPKKNKKDWRKKYRRKTR